MTHASHITHADTLAPLSARTAAQLDVLTRRAECFETGGVVWRRWGEGPPIVLLHGGSGSWRHWIRNIAPLAQHRTVWAPDLPGFGDSPLPHGPVTLQSLATQLAAGLRQALREASTGTFDLAGFSLGASVALETAALLDGHIRHLTLIGCHFGGRPVRPAGLVSLKGIDDPQRRVAAWRNNLHAMMLADEASIDELALHLYIDDASRRTMPPKILEGGDTVRAALPRLHVQGQVSALNGSADRTMPLPPEAEAATLVELRPDATYSTIPQTGHWAMYEAAGRVNDALLAARVTNLATPGGADV